MAATLNILVTCCILWAAPPAVTVNGQPLSAAEWEFLRLTRTADGELTPELRDRLIEQAIERRLIRGFLGGRKIAPPADRLDQQLHELQELVRRRGEEPDQMYARLGLTATQVRQELGLMLAWEAYVQQAVSERQIQQYFLEHKSELDGTRVRVRQIFRRLERDTDLEAVTALLTKLRADIEANRITFDDAARQHSQSPSGQQGGDVGWVGAPGRLPEEVTVAALGLLPGQLGGPLRSAFGLHLIQVTERQAGQLSLEDARPQILERLSGQLWRETVSKERASAKITKPR